MSDTTTQPERKVLSEAFQEAMAGWRLRSAVFLTYSFDPGFFEQEILPVFFDLPMSHAPLARVLHLEDALRETGPVAVYYDRRGLVPGSAPPRTDFQRIGVSHRTGYFHAKNVFLLVERNEGDEGPRRCLIAAALSANLTRSGWWENVEAAHIEKAEERELCSFRDDLLGMVAVLRRVSPDGTDHSALDSVHEFVRKAPQHPQRLADGLLLPRLFAGDRSLPEFLEEVAGHRLRNRCLEVISPYFDNAESMKPLQELKEKFRPREVRVFLPRASDGEAQCSEAYWRSVAASGVSWGTLSPEVVRLSRDQDRFTHAKVYRFFDPNDRRETLFVGSVNMTNAGFGRAGNIESGFLVEVEGQRKGRWWLSVDERTPDRFAGQSTEESAVKGPGANLVIRFDWTTAAGTALWDAAASSPILTLRGSGFWIGELGPLASRVASTLDPAVSVRLKEHLLSSAFVTVSVSGAPDAVVLVDEWGALDKPSLLKTISPTEILRYWSLLSEAQKLEFIEERAADLGEEGLALWRGSERMMQHESSVFATFAHVYLSFGNLERAVRAAILARREKEAVDRLFGQKFDSLRRLVERIRDRAEPNPVHDYVALLCAIQLLETLRKDEPDFYEAHRDRYGLVAEIWQAVAGVRGQFTFDTPEQRADFFTWMERWFLQRAVPPPQEPAA